MSTVSVCLSLLLRQSQQSDTVSSHPRKERKRQRIVSNKEYIHLFYLPDHGVHTQHPVSMYATLAHSLAYGLPEWSHYKNQWADGGTEINGRMIWSQWLWRKPVWCVTEGTWKADGGDKLKPLATGSMTRDITVNINQWVCWVSVLRAYSHVLHY